MDRGRLAMATPFLQPEVVARAAYGGLPLRVRTPMRTVVLVEAPRAVGLTRMARNRCGGK
jgi:hypothetical protein